MAEPDPTTKVVIDISGESSSDHVILEDQQHNKKSSLILGDVKSNLFFSSKCTL
jgi:hypothetical protein